MKQNKLDANIKILFGCTGVFIFAISALYAADQIDKIQTYNEIIFYTGLSLICLFNMMHSTLNVKDGLEILRTIHAKKNTTLQKTLTGFTQKRKLYK